MIDSNQTKSNELERMKQKQEAILARLQTTKFKQLLDSKKYVAYDPMPICISSYVTKGKKPTFICLACDYRIKGKLHFDAKGIGTCLTGGASINYRKDFLIIQ